MAGIDSFTKLCLHLDGNVTDSSLSPITVTNTNVTFTATPAKFTQSGVFNRTSALLTFPDSASFQVGNGDFTVDFWFYPTVADGTQQPIFGDFNAGGTASSIFATFDHPGNPGSMYSRIDFTDVSSAALFYSGSGSVTLSAWNHYAVVRNGTSVDGYLNGFKNTAGVSVGTKTVLSNQSGASRWTIGRLGELTAFYGGANQDEFRWSTGIARYTSTFTPETVPYSASATTGSMSPRSKFWGDI